MTDAVPDWCRAGGEPPCTARIRRAPEDFRVVEIGDFRFDGAGEHDWLRVEKTGVNTAWLARRLAAFAGVPARDVGYAGMKDRHAVTRQWFSVRRPGRDGTDWSALRLPGARLLEVERHSRKLRRGAHRGNAFELTLTDVDGDPGRNLERIAAQGVPNYFGEQRFGHGGGNLALAAEMFAGKRLQRERRALGLSAARAFLFNEVLASRVAAGTWDRLAPGDVANLDGTNSLFDVAAIDETLERRTAQLDLHPTGPLWGRGRDEPGTRLLPSERATASAHATLAGGLERDATAARRALRLKAESLRWTLDGNVLRLGFSLRRGGYATAVLRELVRYVDAAQPSST